MLTHPTIEKLHALHLTAMATAFDQQRSASQYAELGFDDRFGLLVDTEWTAREQRRLTQRLRHAKLRYPASLEDVDFTTPRGLNREVVLSRGDGSYARLLAKHAKLDLLAIDDWLLAPLTDAERRDLLEVLEDRSERASTLMASQLPPTAWHAAIGEPSVADAICDRLIHHAHRLTPKRPTMRDPGTRRGT